ncbi:MAG: hypothetical protein J7480_01150 [Microbacteriaceae bacterium]|nr:hypothetical protein [Microbacteriaceae bacterium]
MGARDRRSVDTVDAWAAVVAERERLDRRRSSGLGGFVVKNRGRVRTVRRLIRDLGFWPATRLIAQALLR